MEGVGGMPIFFRDMRRDPCKKNSEHSTDKGFEINSGDLQKF